MVIYLLYIERAPSTCPKLFLLVPDITWPFHPAHPHLFALLALHRCKASGHRDVAPIRAVEATAVMSPLRLMMSW